MRFLNKTVKLCKENNIKLIFVEIPSDGTVTKGDMKEIKAYASDNGIPFYNMNDYNDQTGFSWQTDSCDGGYHLNVSGASKMTEWLGNKLTSYKLTDHRGDSDYSQWDDALSEVESYQFSNSDKNCMSCTSNARPSRYESRQSSSLMSKTSLYE
jgi:hypothetical protein